MYDQSGYLNALDNMLYKQRMQEPTQQMYATQMEQYQQDEQNKLKGEMDRSRENLEAKHRVYQAHMRMQMQLQAQGHFYPQDMFQTQPPLQNYPLQVQTSNLQQSPYQQIPSPQQLQQLQQIQQLQQQQQILQQKCSPSQVQQQLLLQQLAQPLQVVPTTPYSMPSTPTTPQQLTTQQMFQLQQVLQQKKTEAFSRNKEKLSQMAQIPYGWQFDPDVPLVNLDGTPTAQLRGIILSVFKRFDTDRDFELSLTEANQLNAVAQVQPISEDEFYKINKLYFGFLEEDGVPHGIHPEALLSMFTTNMIEKPENTYQELRNLGYEVNKAILPKGQERQQMKAAFLNFLKTNAAYILQVSQETSHGSPQLPRHIIPVTIPSPVPSPHIPIPSPVQPTQFVTPAAPPLNPAQFPPISSSPPVTISASTCSKCQSPYCVGVC